MICNNINCRVTNYQKGNWGDGVWEYEEDSAWSALQNQCCPGCGEKGDFE